MSCNVDDDDYGSDDDDCDETDNDDNICDCLRNSNVVLKSRVLYMYLVRTHCAVRTSLS